MATIETYRNPIFNPITWLLHRIEHLQMIIMFKGLNSFITFFFQMLQDPHTFFFLNKTEFKLTVDFTGF